jgi:hypothetical protein
MNDTRPSQAGSVSLALAAPTPMTIANGSAPDHRSLSDTEELSGDEESDSVSELKLKQFQEIFHKSFRAGGWHKRTACAFWFMYKFLISARGAGKKTQSSEVPKIAAGK